jgi:type VI protein secretion system component Hcp
MFWKSFARRPALARRPAARKPAATRLGVECLERRVVPTLMGSLSIAGITGDGPNGTIALNSYSFGERAGTAGRPTLGEFHLNMNMNRASPALLQAAMSGTPFKNAVLVASAPTKGMPVEVLRCTLSDVIVSSYQVKSGSAIIPTNDITLNFLTIQEQVTPLLPDGTSGSALTATWPSTTGSVQGVPPQPAKANAAIGFQVDGVPGEFANGSALDSYSLTANTPPGGKASFPDYHIKLKTGVASPYLFLDNDTGLTAKGAVLTVYRALSTGQAEVERITLTGVRVTSYTTADGEDDVTLHFDRIAQTVTPLRADGSAGSPLTATWDTLTGTGGLQGTSVQTTKANTPLGLALAGVQGEYANGFAATSYSWAGMTVQGPADFQVVLPTGTASPYLLLATAYGHTFATVTLTAYKATSGMPVQTESWTLSDVRVTSYTTGDGQDVVTFHFAHITHTYWVTKPDGSPSQQITETW